MHRSVTRSLGEVWTFTENPPMSRLSGQVKGRDHRGMRHYYGLELGVRGRIIGPRGAERWMGRDD